MSSSIKIDIAPLYLPLKTTFRQASSIRDTGESIWVTATRDKHTGIGEGCPRTYVTGEDVDSCLEWLRPQLPTLEKVCIGLPSLKEWVEEQAEHIDRHPAAWCGIETALLDLFARERQMSVEKMLGMEGAPHLFQYTAVLGDSRLDKYEHLIKRYLKMGFTDFKVKLSGDLQRDQLKLDTLQQICGAAGVKPARIRLDANNLWAGKTSLAIDHLSELKELFFGIEEPVEPKNPQALHEISTALNRAVILDESLCNEADLKAYDHLAGQFVANIKVSRVGGVLRSLEMVRNLKKRAWKIIIGAHVGETSVMTRAGMCVAQAAGEHLIGQEGAFGMILLKKEPVAPSLMFGTKGQLDLRTTYVARAEDGSVEYPVETWSKGWGLEQSTRSNIEVV